MAKVSVIGAGSWGTALAMLDVYKRQKQTMEYPVLLTLPLSSLGDFIMDFPPDWAVSCNYSVAVKEVGHDIIFLHKIVKGGTDRSFGIDVAKLAGLPEEVISQARIFLDRLQEYEISLNGLPRERKEEKPENPSTSALPAYIAELKNVNIDTPVSYTHLL